MSRDRLVSIWTELTQRHALLASTVEFESLEEMRFRSVFLIHQSLALQTRHSIRCIDTIHSRAMLSDKNERSNSSNFVAKSKETVSMLSLRLRRSADSL